MTNEVYNECKLLLNISNKKSFISDGSFKIFYKYNKIWYQLRIKTRCMKNIFFNWFSALFSLHSITLFCISNILHGRVVNYKLFAKCSMLEIAVCAFHLYTTYVYTYNGLKVMSFANKRSSIIREEFSFNSHYHVNDIVAFNICMNIF